MVADNHQNPMTAPSGRSHQVLVVIDYNSLATIRINYNL